ncbi:MAG: SH3 domain-containing protein [Roseiflexaceae bacterium]
MKSITSVSLLSVWLLFTMAACAGPLAPPTGSPSTAGPGAPSMTPIAAASTASAAAAAAPTSAPASPTAQPRLSATRPAITTDRQMPPIAQVRNGGNVRTLPSKAGSNVLDQISAGETVLLRMRTPNGQWYSIVDPRGVIGWSWVGLLTVDPAVAASIPVGSADPGVTATAAPTPAAYVDGPQIIEWEGLTIVPPMGYHSESRSPDGVRLYGFPVRAQLPLLSSVPPLDGSEQLNGMIFTIVQFKGTPQDWLDLLRQANDMEFGLDESTVQSTTVAGHPAISYQAGPFQEYIVTGQPGTLLLIDNGARILEHQQVIDSLTFAAQCDLCR